MNQSPSKTQPAQQIPQVDLLKPRKLNWNKVLFDYHICLDAQAFQKWNGDLSMDGQQILQKDLPRTRCGDVNMKKENFKQVLRRITTFYCKQNGVTYQQGLLEVVFPFALLRSKDFKTKKCYAYFNAFMRKHFPKVLVQRIVSGKRQLPHAILAITLTQTLLKFHYPYLSYILKQNEIPMSLIATQELLTIFAKNMGIKFVYEIYDFFIQKKDPNYIFYMFVALLGLQETAIVESAQNETIHKKLQNIKNFEEIQTLQQWFKHSQNIAKTTPQCFVAISNEFCFCNRNLLSEEDVEKMLKSQQLVAGGYLGIGIEEINKDVEKYIFLLLQNQKIHGDHKYRSIKINPQKQPNEQDFNESKIYVLTAHENNLMEQSQILRKYASKLPHLRFLTLRECLIGQKRSKCEIM